MNTRAPGSRPSRRPAPAILLAVAALMLPHASARAGCGSHDARPSIPLGWAETGPVERPDPPDRPPTCSGLTAPAPSLPPIVATPTPDPRLGHLRGLPVDPIPDRRSAAWSSRSDGLDPIGRVTEVERPPCRPRRRLRPLRPRSARVGPISEGVGVALVATRATAVVHSHSSFHHPFSIDPQYRRPVDHASSTSRIHADRIAGRDRHHRDPDRPAPARGPGGPRGRPALAVRQQPEADRPGHPQLCEHLPGPALRQGAELRREPALGGDLCPLVGPQPAPACTWSRATCSPASISTCRPRPPAWPATWRSCRLTRTPTART